jgi:hypothetical protein
MQNSGYKKPSDFHVTCLFIGGKSEMIDHPIMENFTEGKDIDIEITGLLIVPGKVVVGLVYTRGVDIENKYPHMTLMLGSYQAKNSNDALEATCKQGGRPSLLSSKRN